MSKAFVTRYLPATILTVSLFFLWGMANNLNDILIAQFKRAFVLSDFETSFVQQAFYLGYFLLAIPASLLTRARGYKASIVLGLLLYAAGALLFYPAAHLGVYQYFLAALFVIACGLAFLETAANPLVTELGDPAQAASRLNWAQAANPLGTLSGVLIGKFFILSQMSRSGSCEGAAASTPACEAFYREQVLAVQTPYLVIGLVVLGFAALAAMLPFPGNRELAARSAAGDTAEDTAEHTAEHTARGPAEHTGRGPAGDTGAAAAAGAPRFADLLRHPRLVFATLAQFFYIGAQVGLWSYTIRYAMHNVPGMAEATAADYLFASLCLFALGRLIGSALMARVAPVRLLTLFAGAALLLAVAACLLSGRAGLYALVAASFVMSIQFPTIFAIGVSGLGPLRQLGSSLIIMAIIGGAVLTALMGLVSDRSSINGAMLVPAASFAVVVLFGLWAGRSRDLQAPGGREPAPLH